MKTSLWRVATVVAVLSLCVVAHAAPKYRVLHAFGGGKDGGGLWDSLIIDLKGHIYGTTSGGGSYGYGAVFQLTPHDNGGWTEKIIHSFDFHKEGAVPTGSLVLDPAGQLYATAAHDGAHDGGDVFAMTRGIDGWKETVIYSFGDNQGDGGDPYAGLIRDQAGNLYGTTPYGGTNEGTVFQLQPTSQGWNEMPLYSFCSKAKCIDGDGAFAGLILDTARNLYGTTESGGAYGGGTVYEVERTATGWKEKVLHSFVLNYKDGHTPGVGALIMDGAGNLYGTTAGGGCCGGVVFKLTPGSGGHWTETILYTFRGGASGFEPGAGVVMDKAGNLYGTTIAGGSGCGCGVVYELSPNAKGKWKYTVLHTFLGSDGAQPDANLILDDKGNLYGTIATGGANGGGVVFELTP